MYNDVNVCDVCLLTCCLNSLRSLVGTIEQRNEHTSRHRERDKIIITPSVQQSTQSN